MEINSLGFLENTVECSRGNWLQNFAVRNPEKNLAAISSVKFKILVSRAGGRRVQRVNFTQAPREKRAPKAPNSD